MIRKNSGFSLVELMITLVILALVLAGTSDMFVGLLRQFKTQGKIAETGIERIIGLEVLRQDIDSAGYGLPWSIPSGFSYEEASAASFYNDAPVSGPTGTNNNPRAILSGNGRGLFGSDELVIKSTGAARNTTCKKWTRFLSGDSGNVRVWNNGSFSDYENLSPDDWVIFLSPGSSRSLDGVAKFGDRGSFAKDGELIYGITDGSSIRMPFNRADYYITDAPSYVPDRCADDITGVLVKSIISQSTGTSAAAGSRSDQMPLLDCVADMRVVFRLDTDDDGVLDTTSFDISGLNAEQIRNQVKEVHVSILAHEGQEDSTYVHHPTTIYVGNPSIGGGRDYNIGSYVHYRWKVYNISVTPHNLIWGDR